MQALMQGVMAPQANQAAPLPFAAQPSHPSLGPQPSMSPDVPPSWMDAAPPQPQIRTGVQRDQNSGLYTIGFFALIVFAVAAAGVIGIVVWGPEKHSTNRSHLASEPPAASVTAPLEEAPPPVAAAPVDSAPAIASSVPDSKKRKPARAKKH